MCVCVCVCACVINVTGIFGHILFVWDHKSTPKPNPKFYKISWAYLPLRDIFCLIQQDSTISHSPHSCANVGICSLFTVDQNFNLFTNHTTRERHITLNTLFQIFSAAVTSITRHESFEIFHKWKFTLRYSSPLFWDHKLTPVFCKHFGYDRMTFN